MSGARYSRIRAPEGPQLAWPSWSASVSSQVSALASRSSPRSLGSRVEGLGDHPRLGQVDCSPRRRRRRSGSSVGPAPAASLASARTRPWASRVAVASQDAVVRSPVASAMSSAVASTRSCRPGRGRSPAPAPTSRSCFSPVVAELGAIAARSSNPPLASGQGLGVGGGHGTSQPSTTDSGSRSEPLIHKGFRIGQRLRVVSRLVAGEARKPHLRTSASAPRTSTDRSVVDGPDAPRPAKSGFRDGRRVTSSTQRDRGLARERSTDFPRAWNSPWTRTASAASSRLNRRSISGFTSPCSTRSRSCSRSAVLRAATLNLETGRGRARSRGGWRSSAEADGATASWAR